MTMNGRWPLKSTGRATDDGFATVWAAGAVTALLSIYTLVLWLGAATVTRHRAEAAADLAALAAAAHARAGAVAACQRAATVADRMRVRVDRCELSGWDALVEVRAAPPGAVAHLGMVTARARAGPVGR
ncbi:MAG: Rv3654c family TadE-like protein [Haloechinothrix sp.]